MKKVKIFALMGVMALTSALAFTSCKKNDKDVDNGQQQKNEVVKTQFSISVPMTSANGPRRMRGQEVQDNNQFNDFAELVLIPFATQDSIPAADSRLGANIDLTTRNNITATPSNEKSFYYNDVTVPVATASFLVYAKSGASGSDYEKGATKVVYNTSLENRSLETSLAAVKTGADFKFSPVTIFGSETPSGGNSANILNYLNAIANAETAGSVKWSGDNNDGLDSLYSKFISLNAGSSASIQAAVEDLYGSLYKNEDDLSKAICTAIKTKATPQAAPNDNKLTFDSSLDNFPASIGLPDGAAAIEFQKLTSSFSYMSTAVKGNGLASTHKYVFPAELLYVANTRIVVKDNVVLSQNPAYTGTETWADYLKRVYSNNTLTPGAVTSTTRSVSLIKQLNYGVGRFDVAVNLKNGPVTELPMGLKKADGINDSTVAIPAGGYPVTGVLVGGQNTVDYMFHQAVSTENYVIYDSVMNGTLAAVSKNVGSFDAYNYTLVYETPAVDGSPIHFAIELLNTGADFYGAEGIIPTGTKFYMVGKLDAAQAGTGAAAGFIFKQDFNTIANCTINSLANAHNVIPDLRSPEMELGLSVDLHWQAGHIFTIDQWY